MGNCGWRSRAQHLFNMSRYERDAVG